MCWTKTPRGMAFGPGTFPENKCDLCGGDLNNPPPMREWLLRSADKGYLGDDENFF